MSVAKQVGHIGVSSGQRTDLRLENFPQAVQDYSSALEIKSVLLPPSSRALASVHYQLATVLEFTPDRRADALSHVEKALSEFKARLAELQSSNGVSDTVGKLGEKEKEIEVKDVEGLIGDLEVKIEELKAAPPAGDIVSESINHLMRSGEGDGGLGGKVDERPVNDLTGMVKKKASKKAVEGKGKGLDGVTGKVEEKRKVEHENGNGNGHGDEPAVKKARVE